MALTFYPEGDISLPTDNEMRSLHKLVALIQGGGGGGGLAGVGSPEGVVAANPGRTYLDTSTNSFWAKNSGAGTTGWIELII